MCVCVCVCVCSTLLQQTARVSVHGMPLLGDLLERLFLHNYSSTVSNVSPCCPQLLNNIQGCGSIIEPGIVYTMHISAKSFLSPGEEGSGLCCSENRRRNIMTETDVSAGHESHTSLPGLLTVPITIIFIKLFILYAPYCLCFCYMNQNKL